MSLMVNQLAGFGAGGGGSVPAEISFQTSRTSPSTTATRTYTGVSLGDPSADRLIVVTASVLIAPGSGSNVITGATVAGVTATKLVEEQYFAGGNATAAAIFVASVPTGTSGTVIVSHYTAGSISRGGMGCFALYGASPTPVDTGVDQGSGNQSATIDVVAGGAVVGVIGTYTGNSSSSWSGLTERYDALTAGGSAHSGACDNFENAEINRSISVTVSGGAALALASFQPV